MQSLYKRESAPDGPHTSTLTASLTELEQTVRANRPHLRETPVLPPVPTLTDDQKRFIRWYSENAPEVVHLPRPDHQVFVNRISQSNDSGIGIDRVPYAVYRTHPWLFADILQWELEYREIRRP